LFCYLIRPRNICYKDFMSYKLNRMFWQTFRVHAITPNERTPSEITSILKFFLQIQDFINWEKVWTRIIIYACRALSICFSFQLKIVLYTWYWENSNRFFLVYSNGRWSVSEWFKLMWVVVGYWEALGLPAAC